MTSTVVSVSVGVDPATAFTAFTEELDQWWGRGPVNYLDAALAVGVYYAKPATAARWLASVFGFESPDPLPEGPDPLPEGDYGHPWIEFRVGNCSLMVFKLEGDLPAQAPPTHETWVFVDDLDAHLSHAQAGGAAIVQGIRQTGYRVYGAGPRRAPVGLRPGPAAAALTARRRDNRVDHMSGR